MLRRADTGSVEAEARRRGPRAPMARYGHHAGATTENRRLGTTASRYLLGNDFDAETGRAPKT
ncbi:hypothetical protein GCM10017653_00400 [Ancylobacter defluvii]|uniref:Uncharacterized protein n=1 Tax=Ancylobacter defluvii TaxID=1282440 RepID=A0A9W6N926_9HYPH|nr:hypothetical protein GCM10017653_00400 [Ancylobacter defluvii]